MLFKKRKEPDLKRRFGSLAFYIFIPTSLFVGSLVLFQILLLVNSSNFNISTTLLFLHGALAGLIIAAGIRSGRFRTLVHELKHAVLVILTGNKLNQIKVGKEDGLVTYSATKDTLHFEPFVAMAPYFFPLFSSPVLFVALFFEPEGRLHFSYLLGVLLGFDLSFGVSEIHNLQSDLRRIYGGFIATRAFIWSAHFCWIATVFLWVTTGKEGFTQLIENVAMATRYFALQAPARQ